MRFTCCMLTSFIKYDLIYFYLLHIIYVPSYPHVVTLVEANTCVHTHYLPQPPPHKAVTMRVSTLPSTATTTQSSCNARLYVWLRLCKSEKML